MKGTSFHIIALYILRAILLEHTNPSMRGINHCWKNSFRVRGERAEEVPFLLPGQEWAEERESGRGFLGVPSPIHSAVERLQPGNSLRHKLLGRLLDR